MIRLLHDALDQAAAEHPERPAVRCGDDVLSYAELQEQSCKLADLLVDVGIGPGARVAIHQQKSVEMVVAIYGIMRAGCCFVPIDPMSPPSRVASIIADCSVRAVVADATGYKNLQAANAGALDCVVHPRDVSPDAELRDIAHHDWAAVRSRPVTHDLPLVADDDLAYVMYTSGSTGPPKGMMHSHRSSLGFAGWGHRLCELGPTDVVAALSPLHFDISIFDLFSSVLGASCVVLVPQRVQLFPAQLAMVLEETRSSIVFTVPFALTRIAQSGNLAERDLSSLRWVLFGGEPFQPADLAALMGQIPDARYANVYGPAEAPACVVHELSAPPRDGQPVPIGMLAPDTNGRVVAPGTVADVTPGDIGELLIAAPSITLGYWNRDDLNETTRVTIGGAEFFRTGDLVYRGTDELLHFVGRGDRMVKSRGFRIELDEVEAALASASEVREAAVFAVDGSGTKLVHAAIVPSATPLDERALANHLSEQLPAYALPVATHIVDEMPRTTSDKIDRRALADRFGGAET